MEGRQEDLQLEARQGYIVETGFALSIYLSAVLGVE
jgi:hypothetical protein